MKKGTLVVVPARLDATRLPRKPLLNIHGFPMIYWVAHRIKLAGIVDYVVATDSIEIISVCAKYDIPAIMTSGRCRNGTERVAEVALLMPYEYYCNVQGDEPLLNCSNVLALIDNENKRDDVFYQAVCPYDTKKNNDYSVVKTVLLADGSLPFFTRADIPHSRNNKIGFIKYKLLGLYVYSRELLLMYSKLSAGPLEELEKVEQLRCTENGIPVIGIPVGESERSVDTPDDIVYMRAQKKEKFLLM